MMPLQDRAAFRLAPDPNPNATAGNAGGQGGGAVDPAKLAAELEATKAQLAASETAKSASETALKQLRETHQGTDKELKRVWARGLTPKVLEALEKRGLPGDDVEGALLAWANAPAAASDEPPPPDEPATRPTAGAIAQAAAKPLTAAEARVLFAETYRAARLDEIQADRQPKLAAEKAMLDAALAKVPDEDRVYYQALAQAELNRLTGGADAYGYIPATPEQVRAAIAKATGFKAEAAKNTDPTAAEHAAATSGPRGGPGGPGAVINPPPNLNWNDPVVRETEGAKIVEARRRARLAAQGGGA